MRSNKLNSPNEGKRRPEGCGLLQNSEVAANQALEVFEFENDAKGRGFDCLIISGSGIKYDLTIKQSNPRRIVFNKIKIFNKYMEESNVLISVAVMSMLYWCSSQTFTSAIPFWPPIPISARWAVQTANPRGRIIFLDLQQRSSFLA